MNIGRCSRQAIFAAGAALALFGAAALSAEQPWRWSTASRIVVVPDVHGAYPELVALLQATGVIDAALHWSGTDARLVSLGDLLDRGAESRKTMDLFMRLQREAAEDGGAVHVILGNHEAMNLIGDLRYVSRDDYAAFAADEPEGARAAAYERFLARQTDPIAAEDSQAVFDKLYPPGYFGQRSAFAPDGPYGSWLLSLPALIVINDTAFVHGGLSQIVADAAPAAINNDVQSRLRRYLSIRSRRRRR